MSEKMIRIATAGTIVSLIASALLATIHPDTKRMEHEIVAGDMHALGQMQALMDEGNAVAQNWLGLHFQSGSDYVSAARWFLKAADQGNVLAQDNLGNLYETGRGVLPNPVVAYALYSLAASSNQRWVRLHSRTSLQRVGASMSDEQLDAARAIAQMMRSDGIASTLDRIEHIQDGYEP
ncbi:MAG: hypothetical protein M0T86_03210 [Betaproteobacteria bacterium]|nr:hypothetical protein [Betaproteobacteria bacterium]